VSAWLLRLLKGQLVSLVIAAEHSSYLRRTCTTSLKTLTLTWALARRSCGWMLGWFFIVVLRLNVSRCRSAVLFKRRCSAERCLSRFGLPFTDFAVALTGNTLTVDGLQIFQYSLFPAWVTSRTSFGQAQSLLRCLQDGTLQHVRTMLVRFSSSSLFLLLMARGWDTFLST